MDKAQLIEQMNAQLDESYAKQDAEKPDENYKARQEELNKLSK